MAKQPLLIFPKPAPVEREKLPRSFVPRKPFRGGWQDSNVRRPLHELQVSFERRTLELSSTAAGAVAEEVLVLETVGNVADFVNAVRRIPGLEWLVSFDAAQTIEEEDADEEVSGVESDDDEFSGASNRLFAIATNAEALRQLLSLWKRYERREKFEYGFGAWKEVFAQLSKVRRWSVEDRLHETGIVEFWRDALEKSETNVIFGIEFWFRTNAASRRAAFESLRIISESLGGRLSYEYEHEPTGFHAAVATLPPAAVRQFLEEPETSVFLQRTEIMFCRPQGQTAIPLEEGDVFGVAANPTPKPTGEPITALLDGLPLENHAAYAGWLIVDDPDGWSAEYQVGDRQHGTGMASLIVRGDLSNNTVALTSPLYVRPILRPDPADWNQPRAERMPIERFPQDLLEIAVRRFKAGTPDNPAVAASVQVVNLSVGDPSRIFDGGMSPWARMVDYLAWRHNLLFVVSAGNHASIQIDKTLTEWEALTPAEREEESLLACWRDVRNRRLLSPAEAINAITVAAQHSDESGPLPRLGALNFIPIQNSNLASVTSAFGPGYRRSVKPDIVLPGGQQVMTVQSGLRLNATRTAQPPGQLVAVPGATANATGHTRGTSNSAALATRQAAMIVEALRGLEPENGNAIPDEFLPVLTKTLLAHAASAADAAVRLREIFDRNNDQHVDLFRKRHVISTVGYGSVNPARAVGADDHRATLLGWGELAKEEAHEFRLPLPASLNAIRGKRRLTFTLAWFSPINPQSRAYRCARLWLSKPEQTLAPQRAEAEWRSVRNGTLQHEIWEGEAAAVFADGEDLVIRVNCREDGGKLQGSIRYGLAVSIEAAEELQLPIYEEVRAVIAIQEQVRPQ